MAKRKLSLVLPAYKQENTIVKDIDTITGALTSAKIEHELIVVVDGFEDKTYQKVNKLNRKNLVLIGYKINQGKGFAVKKGVEKANGDIIGFIDAGMDLDPKEITLMLDIMDWNKADIVIGSKLHPDSKVEYPVSRRILSWGYRSIVRFLFDLNVKDTQVGLKIFRKPVAKKVFKRIVENGFVFDVEVLAIAGMLGYNKIYEAPIRLKFRQGSIASSNYWKHVMLFLISTFAVFYRMNIRHSYK